MGKYVAHQYEHQIPPTYQQTIVDIPDPKAAIMVDPLGFASPESGNLKSTIAIDIS
jgi:hypothetical protein